MATIDETPKVRYFEAESNPFDDGDGAQIPVIIGYSSNETKKPAETADIQEKQKLKVVRYRNYKACAKTQDNGGIGTDEGSNPLLDFTKEFFEEARKTSADDVTVPYIYVIDLGKKPEADEAGNDTKLWLEAFNLAKTKRDSQVEVYVGLAKKEAEDDSQNIENIIALMTSAVESITADSQDGNPRIGYFTVSGADDDYLMKLTEDSESHYIQNPRLGLIEPKYFGKSVAKICCTPYYEEPGYTDFRSIEPGEFNNRTPEDENTLQSCGVIFIRDEIANSAIHPRINLAVSTAFAANPSLRANDSLLHARRNTDHLVRVVYDILYEQLKRNETQVNLAYLRTDINLAVNEEITKGYMMNGTQLEVRESEKNPYDLRVEGVAIPVNSTLLIGFSLYVEAPNAVSVLK